MKKVYAVLIALFLSLTGFSQSCLPEGIEFTTQSEIDNFQINYPNCTQIEGYVIIDGSEITNLNGLSALTSIADYLNIKDNDSLSSLTGFDNLIFIGGYLSIYRNPVLTNLIGLGNLDSIADDLAIGYNNALTSLSGLNNLIFIGGYLWVDNNGTLPCLTGLDNIDAGSILNLTVINNINLSTCEVRSICDYLAIPNGEIYIHDNATGCNSQEEVEAACEVGLDENATPESQIILYPNPASTQITISTPPTTSLKNTFLTIIDITGQEVLKYGLTQEQTVIDVSGLSQGVYFVKVSNDRTVKVGKFVKQ
jgi:hypothetical protein